MHGHLSDSRTQCALRSLTCTVAALHEAMEAKLGRPVLEVLVEHAARELQTSKHTLESEVYIAAQGVVAGGEVGVGGEACQYGRQENEVAETGKGGEAVEGYQKYPKSEKAPINLLKLGVSLVQIGEKDQGCLMITGVEKQYPEATKSVLQKAKYEEKKFACQKNNS